MASRLQRHRERHYLATSSYRRRGLTITDRWGPEELRASLELCALLCQHETSGGQLDDANDAIGFEALGKQQWFKRSLGLCSKCRFAHLGR
jgi:hypothetical protein